MEKFFIDMTDEELSRVNLEEFTKLKIGDKITHMNAGKPAGSAGIIFDGEGIIVSMHNQGLYSWGGLCVTIGVDWDNGESYTMLYSLAKKI